MIVDIIKTQKIQSFANENCVHNINVMYLAMHISVDFKRMITSQKLHFQEFLKNRLCKMI